MNKSDLLVALSKKTWLISDKAEVLIKKVTQRRANARADGDRVEIQTLRCPINSHVTLE